MSSSKKRPAAPPVVSPETPDLADPLGLTVSEGTPVSAADVAAPLSGEIQFTPVQPPGTRRHSGDPPAPACPHCRAEGRERLLAIKARRMFALDYECPAPGCGYTFSQPRFDRQATANRARLATEEEAGAFAAR